MSLVAWGRLGAAVISLSTFVFLFVHDSWHVDNMFLVPDLILIVALAVGAALPERQARVALPIAFAYAAGVLATSAASYAVRSEVGLPSLVGAAAALVLAALMATRHGPQPVTAQH